VTGSSTERAKTVLHPVFDLTAAKPVYAALLGVAPQHDSDYCVGFDVAGQDIGMVPGGGRGEGRLVAMSAARMATYSGCFRTARA
jgi:hypothetical protein